MLDGNCETRHYQPLTAEDDKHMQLPLKRGGSCLKLGCLMSLAADRDSKLCYGSTTRACSAMTLHCMQCRQHCGCL